MFLPRHASGYENPEMADMLVDRVDDGLTTGEEVFIFFVEIDDPAEGLLRGSDVVALGAKADINGVIKQFTFSGGIADMFPMKVFLHSFRSALPAPEKTPGIGDEFLGIPGSFSSQGI